MRQRTTINATALLILLGTVGLFGCDNLAALYGFSSGGNGNPNTSDDPPPEGTTRLTPITFSPASGFPQGVNSADFEVSGGSITAIGGTAGTLGRFGLYADDLFAWDFFAGSTGGITFNNLEVVAVDGYWVQPNAQSAGAIMSVNFSGGGSFTVASAPIEAFGNPGQAEGFFERVSASDDETIVSLTFTFDDGASDGDVAALDVLELTVRNQ